MQHQTLNIRLLDSIYISKMGMAMSSSSIFMPSRKTCDTPRRHIKTSKIVLDMMSQES